MTLLLRVLFLGLTLGGSLEGCLRPASKVQSEGDFQPPLPTDKPSTITLTVGGKTVERSVTYLGKGQVGAAYRVGTSNYIIKLPLLTREYIFQEEQTFFDTLLPRTKTSPDADVKSFADSVVWCQDAKVVYTDVNGRQKSQDGLLKRFITGKTLDQVDMTRPEVKVALDRLYTRMKAVMLIGGFYFWDAKNDNVMWDEVNHEARLIDAQAPTRKPIGTRQERFFRSLAANSWASERAAVDPDNPHSSGGADSGLPSGRDTPDQAEPGREGHSDSSSAEHPADKPDPVKVHGR